MAKIKFTRRLGTNAYGTVEVGDVVDVSEQDARRYIANNFAEPIVHPKKRAPTRGRPAGRNGKEG